MTRELTYSVVTPVRNEAHNLPRLAECMLAQTTTPSAWVVVDNGSSDDTPRIARELAQEHEWIQLLTVPGTDVPTRGAPIVRAFTAGLGELAVQTDIIVKLDADISFGPEHFGSLLTEFTSDERLGIAGGICLEEKNGRWLPQHTTRNHVRGAERAYRRQCLDDVLPLEEHMGWDGIDEVKAAVAGWRTASFSALAVRHHRSLGEREDRLAKWIRQGDMAHYMHYRPSYLVFRALYRALTEPSALAMLLGYVAASLQARPQCDDPRVKDWLRREQGVRKLGSRAREALGRV